MTRCQTPTQLRHRLSTTSPRAGTKRDPSVSDTVPEASRRLRERVEIERRLFVRVRGPERRDDFRLALCWIDRFEPQLRDALFAPGLAHRRLGPLAAEKGP